jgi:ferredoxin--NADP+ reductase
VADGLLSPLLQQLKPGDTVQVSQPASGFFVLDEVPDGKNLWLISTGTGIGPYLSMLGTDTPWQRFSSIVLLHSVRFAAELVYQPRIQQLQQRYGKQLHYQSVVTRAQHTGALQQRIPDLISSGQLQTSCGQTLDTQSQVLLCGNPQMITETKAVLEGIGLKKNLRRDPGQITVEQYWK